MDGGSVVLTRLTVKTHSSKLAWKYFSSDEMSSESFDPKELMSEADRRTDADIPSARFLVCTHVVMLQFELGGS